MSEQEIYEKEIGKPAQYSRKGKMWDTISFTDWKRERIVTKLRKKLIEIVSKQK